MKQHILPIAIVASVVTLGAPTAQAADWQNFFPTGGQYQSQGTGSRYVTRQQHQQQQQQQSQTMSNTITNSNTTQVANINQNMVQVPISIANANGDGSSASASSSANGSQNATINQTVGTASPKPTATQHIVATQQGSAAAAAAASAGGSTKVVAQGPVLTQLPEAGVNPAIAGSGLAGLGAAVAMATAYARKQKAILAALVR